MNFSMSWKQQFMWDINIRYPIKQVLREEETFETYILQTNFIVLSFMYFHINLTENYCVVTNKSVTRELVLSTILYRVVPIDPR